MKIDESPLISNASRQAGSLSHNDPEDVMQERGDWVVTLLLWGFAAVMLIGLFVAWLVHPMHMRGSK